MSNKLNLMPPLKQKSADENSQSQTSEKTELGLDVESQNVFSSQVKKDFGMFVGKAREYFKGLVAQKMWRMEVMGQINAFVSGENRQLKEGLNIRHNLEDLNLYSLTKRQVLEEDIFTHFYPFCMVNCTLATVFCLRKTSWKVMGLGAFLMVEYIYFLFNFPVEAWHFHRRAISTDKQYAQMIRDSFIERFPDSAKALKYQQVNMEERKRYQALRHNLNI